MSADSDLAPILEQLQGAEEGEKAARSKGGSAQSKEAMDTAESSKVCSHHSTRPEPQPITENHLARVSEVLGSRHLLFSAIGWMMTPLTSGHALMFCHCLIYRMRSVL